MHFVFALKLYYILHNFLFSIFEYVDVRWRLQRFVFA